MRSLLLSLLLIPASATAPAQWTIQSSPTTASLRGIHAVSPLVAWASGSQGTVLHTTDGGLHWLLCPTPPDAANLDFRGIQAFDAHTAIVMSSGKGDLSRLYKTTDACLSWTLAATNPDKDGFWDAVRILPDGRVEVVGDSVDHVLVSEKLGHIVPVWQFQGDDDPADHFTDSFFELAADPKEGGFAASNSTLVLGDSPHPDPTWRYQWLATGTPDHSYVHREETEETPTCEPCRVGVMRVETPMSQGLESAGIFSLAFRKDRYGVAVGGDYQRPNATPKTAVFSDDSGQTWLLAQTPPHGYRSAVAYNPATKSWITVGPNGTDISTDDGRNWHPALPQPGEPADSDKNWNALSLPFVVGSHGRIGRLAP